MSDALHFIKNFYYPIYKDKTIPSENILNELSISAKENHTVSNIIEFLSRSTVDTMTHHFGVDLASQESLGLQEIAFIRFGEGTLFDDTFSPDTITQTRRPLPYMVHMMDGSTYFYYLWHLVISQYMRNISSLDDPVLLQLNRYICFTAEIDFIQKPKQSVDPVGVNPKNPKIDDTLLSNLRTKWLPNTDFNEIGERMRILMGNFWERIR
jgi:hypothetical protein